MKKDILYLEKKKKKRKITHAIARILFVLTEIFFKKSTFLFVGNQQSGTRRAHIFKRLYFIPPPFFFFFFRLFFSRFI